MQRLVDKQKHDAIIKKLLIGKYKVEEIAKRHHVNYGLVNRMQHTIKHNQAEQKPVYFGNKTEAYFTEHEALNNPVYTAVNNHLIKPMQKGWNLYSVV